MVDVERRDNEHKAIPAMIIDSHTHAFPLEIRRNREHFFDGEPAFKLLYDSPKSRLVGAAEIIAMMDDQGVDKSVLFGFPWRDADTFEKNNDYILEAVRRYPDRLIGLCCLDPLHPRAPHEVERCLTNGLSGVGELAFYTSGIDEQCLKGLEPIMALSRAYEGPVMIHTNEPVGHQYPGKTPNTLAEIYAMIKTFPDNKIILAHWGGGIFLYALLKREVRETLANVWFDSAASPFLYEAQIYRQAIALAGQDKVLFGTDFPLLKPRTYFREMDRAGLTTTQKDRILGINAAKLYGLT